MEESIFREKSLQRISSPEDMNDYLRVTDPAIWIVLAAVILLLVSLFVWSSFVSIESRISGTASVADDVVTITLDDESLAANVETGMEATVGGVKTTITYVGTSTDGKLQIGTEDVIPNGQYQISILYRTTRIIRMLFE